MTVPVLNRQLVLERPVAVPDAGGGVTTEWTKIGTHWAELSAGRATEALSGMRENTRVTHRIVIRSAPIGSPRRPRADCRFRLGSRLFAIRGIAERDQRGQYLICWAEEGAFS